MSKEQLKVVSSDPIDLDETSDKTETKDSENPTEVSESVISDKTKSEPTETKAPEEEEEAPKAPPRPVSPLTTMKTTLKEAFPTIDERIITGVLIASQGNMDNSFNALLFISDESVDEPAIPVQSEAPQKPSRPSAVADDSDEALARRLQKEFEMEERRRRRHQKDSQRRQLQNDAEDDSPDEFEQIKETFNQGLQEARTTLNGWVSGLAKRIDGGANQDQNKQPPKLFGALGGSSAAKTRRFDDDAPISANEFNSKIELNDNEGSPALPKRKTNDWQEPTSTAPVNSDAFMVTDSEDEDKKDIKL